MATVKPKQAPLIDASTGEAPKSTGGKRLNERERALVEEVAKGKSVAASARALSIPESTANKMMSRPQARAMLASILNESGLTQNYLVDKLKEVIEGNRTGLTAQGDVVDMGPDWQNRNKALETAFKLHDAFPNPKVDVEVTHKGAVILRAEDLVGDDPFGDVVEGEFSEV